MRISGVGDVKDAVVFHAGTKRDPASRDLLTAGGRVLGVTARGDDLAISLERTYAAVRRIHFDGAHFRKDIGSLGLRRIQSTLQSQ
jgi:phosphoribosylamine--glycine ligase